VWLLSCSIAKIVNTNEGEKENIGSKIKENLIDVKLPQHDVLPRRNEKFHWSKNQPIRKSENKKTPLWRPETTTWPPIATE